MKSNIVRVYIYSKLYGNQCFAGLDYADLKARALQAVNAYSAAGIEARFIG